MLLRFSCYQNGVTTCVCNNDTFVNLFEGNEVCIFPACFATSWHATALFKYDTGHAARLFFSLSLSVRDGKGHDKPKDSPEDSHQVALCRKTISMLFSKESLVYASYEGLGVRASTAVRVPRPPLA